MKSGDKKMKLYSYWRSSCSFRVRIALNLKGLKCEYRAVERHDAEFEKLSPLGYVPVLVDGDTVVADSYAIIMYLEDKYPLRPLLPPDIKLRVLNHQAANIVFSYVQPLQNSSVINYIEKIAGADEKSAWTNYHIAKGFSALEKLLKDHVGKYATGDEVLLADLFLAPQLYSAKRFNVDMTKFPTLVGLSKAYKDVPAFEEAMPERQPDAPSPASQTN